MEPYYTSDGGLTWNPAQSIPAPLPFEVVHDNTQYVLGENIWATSTQGRVFYSYDKGHKWGAASVASFQFPLMFRVAFFDPMEGIAVRYNFFTSYTDSIYRTHDGGKTWSLISHTGPVFLSYPAGALFVVPGSNIVFANGGGSNYYGSSFSADSGTTWTAIDDAQRYGVLDGNGWNSLWAGQYSNTMGEGGIAKWDGIYLGINEASMNVDLSVYPNPCNGKLNITSSGNIANLEIIDPLGHTIYQTKPETNSVSLRLDYMGIYFIRITLDKQTITKKLIVYH